MINVKEETDLQLVGLSVVKFYGEWCAPCKKIDTVLLKMEKEFETIKIYSVDIDKQIKFAKKYRIMSVPTLIFFNGEKEFGDRLVGLCSTEQIRKAFKKLIQPSETDNK